MRILSYNILKNGRGRITALAEVIRTLAPDIVILLEAFRADAVQMLAHQAGYPYYGTHPTLRCSTAFLSRAPIEHQWHALPRTRSPFLELRPAGLKLALWGVHLQSLPFRIVERYRENEINRLLSVIAPQVPHVLMGDFNAVAPNDAVEIATYPRYLRWGIQWQGGTMPREALGRLLQAGYIDAYRQCHPTENGWTLPAHQPNTRLDYAFLTPTLLPRLRTCEVITQPPSVRHASDHLPLLLELDL
jgi:endonuclease/exonuclease/phosphatase family metal-dependent hydrolase